MKKGAQKKKMGVLHQQRKMILTNRRAFQTIQKLQKGTKEIRLARRLGSDSTIRIPTVRQRLSNRYLKICCKSQIHSKFENFVYQSEPKR